MKDLFGKALLDYQNGHYTEDLITSTHISEDDLLPLPYLFRTYKAMPKIERKALALCSGEILDVGCGSGLHSLYLQSKGYETKAIDISAGAIEVAKQRGLKNAEQISLLEESGNYDTILLLMNGSGIFQTLAQTPLYLAHLKTLLKPGGQILIDSSDIKYMYEDEDGGLWIDANADYYGELDYFLSYKGAQETPMKWLYLDFGTLRSQCSAVGLKCTKILEGDHYDYLARLSI